MSQKIEVTVGPKRADFVGGDHLILQSAVDYVTKLGGGTVRILPGRYEMGNSLFLRDKLHLLGSGEETILRKCPSASTPLIDDTDWYDTTVHVKDPSIFRVGGGLLLRSKCPFYANRMLNIKLTVTGIEGNVIHIDRDPREDLWPEAGAEAVTLFPVVTGNYVNDITIENLTIDGNRTENEHLDGNYSGAIFMQDCDRVVIRNVTTCSNNGDGISWQVCDDVTIENCRSLNNADLGLHPGSGSQRPIIRNNTVLGCGIGLYFCWGIKNGLAEGNVIEDSKQYGLSIGHRDTDNVVRDNVIRRSGINGLQFRDHKVARRNAHRNLFEGNLIEDSGTKGDCVAIELQGVTEDVILRKNRVQDTRRRSRSRHRVGLRVGEKARRLCLEGNTFEGLEEDIVYLRGK
ncbi:MAG: right-handed parallel beta-helix repeat-containing protein [Armatimonadetes bacterium]|nr:right-handed parallel beta-helix repeat-containing protein [Armatimonadota bacterium]